MVMDWFYRQECEKAAGSQAPVTPPGPLKVSELSAIIETVLDDPQLQDIMVRGEITNYSHHARGHRYFSLSEKGEGSTVAVIKCVMWRSDADRLPFTPAEGMEIVATGTVRLYAPHGAYQLQVRTMKRDGLGEKFLLLAKWKEDLTEKGYFAASRKRCLPPHPSCIGVVTSETGAVIHDIMNVVKRRYPVRIVLSPTAVQGEDAHREIAAAIRKLAGMVDVVIVARGGGSFEDLFPFNHPDVVEAIAACPVPVVSAIGHEVDITLADFAADLRAPTPSAAAELVVPDRKVLLESLAMQRLQMNTALLDRVARAREDLGLLRDRMRPQKFTRRVDERRQRLADLSERLDRALASRFGRERLIIAEIRTAIEARSPLAVLSRGYCVVEKESHVARSTGSLAPQDRVRIRFADGRVGAVIETVERFAGNIAGKEERSGGDGS
jgi:exodeoxyribonuclease VII large subunit